MHIHGVGVFEAWSWCTRIVKTNHDDDTRPHRHHHLDIIHQHHLTEFVILHTLLNIIIFIVLFAVPGTGLGGAEKSPLIRFTCDSAVPK